MADAPPIAQPVNGKIITPPARLSFPWLFEPQQPLQVGGKPMFSAVLLFPKSTDLSVLKAAIIAARDAKWPDPTKRPKGLRNPLRDGAEKDLDGYKDCFFLSAKSLMRPGVVDEGVKAILDPTVIYAGCWVRASLSVYGYDKAGNKGVAFGLQNIQKLKDDAPFGSRAKPEDDFEAVARQAKSAGAAAAATVIVAGDEWGEPAAGAGEPEL